MGIAIPTLIAQENARWKVCAILPSRQPVFDSVARRLCAPGAKARYQWVEKQTGVPWFTIAIIHERECSQNWNGNIAQGDPWSKVSTRVPKGRGPFTSWENAAIDALVNCAPKAAKWTDWSVGGMLTILELYNGLGYANGPVAKGVKYPPMPSPYIWAGTSVQKPGKYVADGVFDPEKMDTQLGCAGMLMAMAKLDSSIVLTTLPGVGNATTRISPSLPQVPVTPPPAKPAGNAQKPVDAPKPAGPSIANPAKGSIGDAIAGFLRAIFGKK